MIQSKPCACTKKGTFLRCLVEKSIKRLKRMILGTPLRDEQIEGQQLSSFWGLPIMASDAVSSVAYAVEEILLALIPALGLMSVQYVGAVSVPIIVLLCILVFSYTQIINHYPNGGGAYIVSRENFGHSMSLLASSALIIDYIMTVAVSISSSTAAILAAFPPLRGYGVIISLICLGIVTLINLRGVSESSKIFGIPTYVFIVSMIILILMGFIRIFMGTMHPITYTAAQIGFMPKDVLSGITILLFLKAFSSGCSALTGVEAVSNAIPLFKAPAQRTAKRVLFMLGMIIIFIFGGTSFLATTLKVVPLPGTTVMSQMATSVFGNGIMFYILQFSTSLILLLAANTAYNGLPVLFSVLAKDHLLPHQFSHRGTKLSFSNGIMFLSIIGAILLIVSGAEVHKLIPFYAVGVFISFTISQAGMFLKWIKTKEEGWKHKSLINLAGTIITFIGTIVVFTTKFTSGAWALLIAIPIIILFMHITGKNYEEFGNQISLEGYDYKYKKSKSTNKNQCVVLIHDLNRASLKTFEYALSLTSNVTVLHFSTTPEHTKELQKKWKHYKIDIPLTIIPAPYRDIITPLEEYLDEQVPHLASGEKITVLLSKFVGHGWRDNLLYNQNTYFIEQALDDYKDVVTALVPYVCWKSRGN